MYLLTAHIFLCFTQYWANYVLRLPWWISCNDETEIWCHNWRGSCPSSLCTSLCQSYSLCV